MEFSCSSEYPVTRYFGEEILDHSPESINLSRFEAYANVLWNHNSDCPIGVIERAWVQERKLRVGVRFSKNSIAQEKLQDIKDGILRNVSIGYVVNELRCETMRDDGMDTYRAMSWTPMEVSIVTVPADYRVGIGRSESEESYPVTIKGTNSFGTLEATNITEASENLPTDATMPTMEEIMAAVRAEFDPKIEPAPAPQPQVISAERETQIRAQEAERCASILALGNRMGNPELAQKLIEENVSIAEANRQFLALQQQQTPDAKPLANPLPKPMVNTSLGANRDHTQGRLREFESLVDGALSAVWVDKQTGRQVVQRYNGQIDQYFRENQDALRVEIEAYARAHGLLCGSVATETRASTAKTDVPSLLLDYLSAYVRVTHTPQFIWWQFPNYNLELGKGPGDTIQVSRDRYIPAPASINDRILTPGVDLSSSRQPVSVGAVSVTLKELGLGKDGVSGAEPIGIPQFVSAYSMRPLETIVRSRLGHDYQRYIDMVIRNRYAATTRVVYNKRGAVELTPANVGTGDDGRISETFLNNLYSYMVGNLQIPVDEMGCLNLVLPPTGTAQLRNSLGERMRYITTDDLRQLSNLMSSTTNFEIPVVSGYLGTYCNFHIFTSNASSVGNAGSEGVQNETLGVGSRLTRSSYAFGANAVARAIGMEVQIRMDEMRRFQRLDSYIWYSQEEVASLDVDPAVNAEQQLRVVNIRTTDVAV